MLSQLIFLYTFPISNYKTLLTNSSILKKIINLINYIKYVNYLYYYFKIIFFLSFYPFNYFSLMFERKIIK